MDMNLETTRLWLWPFTLADANDLHQLWTEPAVRKYLWDDQIISRDTVVEVIQASEKSFAEYGFGFWTISDKSKSATIGFCGLRHFLEDGGETTEVEVLYGLSPSYWGKGLSTEAAQQVMRYGFEQAGLEAIYAGADPPNQASFRVMVRLGMKFLRSTTVGGLEAIYYTLHRNQFHHVAVVFQDQDSELS